MDKKRISVICFSLAILFCAIGIVLFSTSFITIKFGSLEKNYTGFDLLFHSEEIVKSDGSIWNVELTFGCLIMGILVPGIVFISDKMQKKLKKSESGLAKTIRMMLLPVIAAVPLFSNLLILKISGLDANPLAHLGGGAIGSGICAFIGLLCAGHKNYFRDQANKNDPAKQ